MTTIWLSVAYLLAVAITIVFLGWTLFIFIKDGVPAIERKIENHYRERHEVDFWLMVAVVRHEIPEYERDAQIQRIVKWSDRRWDKFKEKYQKQKVCL